MIKKIIFTFLFFISLFSYSIAQVDDIPLSNSVYEYLKIMSVKKVLPSINNGNPNLTRGEVMDYLNQIDSQKSKLNTTELKALKKYHTEFFLEEMNKDNSALLLGRDDKLSKRIDDIFSVDKKKFLYAYKQDNNNFFWSGIGHLYAAKEFKPDKDSTGEMVDMGTILKGTMFGHLGYYLSFYLGYSFSASSLNVLVDPRLATNFKFSDIKERTRSYNFTDGYLKYYAKPTDNMAISVQLGREHTTYGLGYSNSLMLSGVTPDMDFLKFDMKWGIADFSSIHASILGPYNVDKDSNYTKYIVLNRLNISFKNLFDFAFYEGQVYSRGLELGYLTPFAFYKFVEMSIQDRDNGVFGMDFQTHCFKNVEIQGSFFLDEDILFNLQHLDSYTNKTAYQLGTYIYEPLNIKNLSMIIEYTKIRPFVYTHSKNFTEESDKDTYTSYGVGLGHPIGPNSDQIFTKFIYNLNERMTFNFEYQHIRHGDNITDANGILIKNVGGNIFAPWYGPRDSQTPVFLDGERINTDVYTLDFRYEPINSFLFDLIFNYQKSNNTYTNIKTENSFCFLRFTLDY